MIAVNYDVKNILTQGFHYRNYYLQSYKSSVQLRTIMCLHLIQNSKPLLTKFLFNVMFVKIYNINNFSQIKTYELSNNILLLILKLQMKYLLYSMLVEMESSEFIRKVNL